MCELRNRKNMSLKTSRGSNNLDERRECRGWLDYHPDLLSYVHVVGMIVEEE